MAVPALTLGTVGCATVASTLPTVIAAVTDGIMVLDSIENFIDLYFRAQPNPGKQAKVDEAVARARGALNAALRIAKGADNLNQAKVDEAFAEFRKAYVELIALVGEFGVRSGGSGLRAAPGELTVPAPMALTLKV